MLGASALLCFGVPTTGASLWQVTYPTAANGRTTESSAVPVNDQSLLVAVAIPGTDTTHAVLRGGNQVARARLIGHDPVSSLAFLRVEGQPVPKSADWLSDSKSAVGSVLQATGPDGPAQCRVTGWVTQVGTKILPFALLQVTFDQSVPLPGTPLLDPQGRVAAIIFQGTGAGNGGYAIPSEAVHRVRRDISSGGRLIRGWLGLSLLASNKSPEIVQVLPNSPAAAAGIRPSDILLTVGNHPISQYSDVSNAFFYLIPGQPVRVKIQRGPKQLEFTVTPTLPRAE